MPKRTTAADRAAQVRVTIVTLDGHLGCAADRAFAQLRRQAPQVDCSLHVAGEWAGSPDALTQCIDDIGRAHIIIVSMLFMEDHFRAVLPALEARREQCDAMLCFMSAGEVMRLTRIGGFSMDGEQRGPLALLKKLRGARNSKHRSSGAKQVALLKRLPRILKFIPGTAQDMRAYFLAMQYWLAGSEDNIRNLVALMVSRYATGPRKATGEALKVEAPVEYPEIGIYHPELPGRVTESRDELDKLGNADRPSVGVLVMRSYILAGNTAHYDALIAEIEARGLAAVPVYASGLDARPAVERFFLSGNRPAIDAFVSLTGFSLVGGPAYNDAGAAARMLEALDVPCFAAHATEFQTLEAWQESDAGLLPVETTMMVAIPELDGAIAPTLFGGKPRDGHTGTQRELMPRKERVEMLAKRVARSVELRRTPRDQRKLAIVLFNFPPDGGATGTAAYLSVFRSLKNVLSALDGAGYEVDIPEDVDALRDAILLGNSGQYGSAANVHDRIPADDHVRREPFLAAIEKEWGPAPGKHNADGSSIHVLGRQFGNVLVAVQPAFGYEGDPMRLLFDKGLAPTHAFSAFYRYLREDFGANAVLHFGTHGALEFMPGKQTGMSDECWPERLIGDLPNFYLYAANNPSEATIAKRRSAATLISYLTPAVTEAGLYNELADLKASIDRYRSLGPDSDRERTDLAGLIGDQARQLELRGAPAGGAVPAAGDIAAIAEALEELRTTLIPNGMHVVGEPVPVAERRDLLRAVAGLEAPDMAEHERAALVDGVLDGSVTECEGQPLVGRLAGINSHLCVDSEISSLVHALDGGFVPPVAGGDLLRSADILPTGRNIHGFDPHRLPSAHAVRAGSAQADELLAMRVAENGNYPESVALVLWGSDNIKSEGAPIGQALRLLGATPRFDSYGRLAGAELVPLEELGRPRIDVVMTLSGIFRDLLPHQTRLLAEAAWLAATAEEPLEKNYVRKHVLAYQEDCGCDLETAALRVYSNAVGAYGSNVNLVIESGRWEDDDELAEQYSQRKCFAYGRDGAATRHEALLERSLRDVEFTYQNLESAELGITSIDHYFDTLGGISRAVQRARGEAVEVYIGDQTGTSNRIRTLAEQVALETHGRILNPRWYEGLLEHGYEGVRQIESHVTNTVGWSATTGQVAPWVYQRISETYVLDKAMRERLAALNPLACAKVAHRLLEAHDRKYWFPDEETLAALEAAGEELEDHIEGVAEVAA